MPTTSAIANNPAGLLVNDQILNQHDATEQATLGVRLARNAFQPKVTPNVLGSFGQTDVNSQNYRIDVSQKFVSGTEIRLGAGTSTAQIPAIVGEPSSDIRFYNADTTLTLSQPLLRGLGPGVARSGFPRKRARVAAAGASRDRDQKDEPKRKEALHGKRGSVFLAQGARPRAFSGP